MLSKLSIFVTLKCSCDVGRLTPGHYETQYLNSVISTRSDNREGKPPNLDRHLSLSAMICPGLDVPPYLNPKSGRLE